MCSINQNKPCQNCCQSTKHFTDSYTQTIDDGVYRYKATKYISRSVQTELLEEESGSALQSIKCNDEIVCNQDSKIVAVVFMQTADTTDKKSSGTLPELNYKQSDDTEVKANHSTDLFKQSNFKHLETSVSQEKKVSKRELDKCPKACTSTDKKESLERDQIHRKNKTSKATDVVDKTNVVCKRRQKKGSFEAFGHSWELEEETVQRISSSIRHLAKLHAVQNFSLKDKYRRRKLYDKNALMENKLTYGQLATVLEKFNGNWDSVLKYGVQHGLYEHYPCAQCNEMYGFKGVSNGKCNRCNMPVRTLRSFVDEIKGLQELVKEKKFVCHDVLPDGNCLFAALADQLYIRGIFHFNTETLRQAAVQYLQSNPTSKDGTSYVYFLENETWTSYLSRMSKDGVWGDHIMLSGMAEMLRTTIIVLRGTSGSKMTVIKPTIEDATPEQKPLYIALLNETHYLSLRPKDWREQLYKDVDVLSGPKKEVDALNPKCLDIILQQVLSSTFLKPYDQEFLETLYPTKFLYGGFAIEIVGSYINMMLPNVFDGDNNWNVNKLFKEQRASASFENNALCCLYIPAGINVKSAETSAKYDLIAEGNCLEKPFRLVPKTPSVWKMHTVKSCDKTYLCKINQTKLASVNTYVKLRTVTLALGSEYGEFAIFMEWPECAKEWLSRKRPSGFLNKSAIQTIQKLGCHVVPYTSSIEYGDIAVALNPDENKQNHSLWTLSFAVAEKEFCRFLSHEQRLCFLLLRCFFYKSVIGTTIPNYIIKHAFFYALDNIKRLEWKENPGQCILVLLKNLYRGFQNKVLPHYFLSQKNLLDDISTTVVVDVTRQLSGFLDYPLWAIYKALDVINLTNSEIGALVTDAFLEIAQCVLQEIKNDAHEALSTAVLLYFQQMTYIGKFNAVYDSANLFYPCSGETAIEKLLHLNPGTLPLHEYWSLCLFFDLKNKTDLTSTRFGYFGHSVHISEVFGEKATDLVLDVCIPEEALVENGWLCYPLTLFSILSEVSNFDAIIECLKFYLQRYIELAGESLFLKIAKVASISCLMNVYRLHICLFNTCVRNYKTDHYRDFLPHLEQVVAFLNTDFHYENLRMVQATLSL